jgi:hypothetical protein
MVHVVHVVALITNAVPASPQKAVQCLRANNSSCIQQYPRTGVLLYTVYVKFT